MENEDRHIEFKEQIVRFLAGEMSVSEEAQFRTILKTEEDKQSLFSEYARIWKSVDKLASRSVYDLDAEWILMEEKINFNEKQVKTLPLRKLVLRIAAAVFIGLAGVAGWYTVRSTSSYELLSQEQGTEQIHLPDGSVVTLNEGSTLKYSMDEKSGQRKVILSGEAFFEVARDTLRPFKIDAGAASVEVLGTSFNVNAYKNNSMVEVTVKSGLVAMSPKRNSANMIILNPGNSGIYIKSDKKLELIAKADVNNIAWKTRELLFSETSLSEVVSVINHVYQENLKLSDPSLADCPITVSFSNQEFSAVLKVLCSTLDLEWMREGDAIVLSGEGCN